MANSPIYPAITGPIIIKKRILPADTNSIVDIYDNSAGSVGVKIEGLVATSTNDADTVLKFYLYDGSTSLLMGSVKVPDLSGTDGDVNPRVNILTTLGISGPDDVLCIWVPVGCKLQVSSTVTLTAAKVLDITGRGIVYN